MELEIVQGVLKRDIRFIAKAISNIENETEISEKILSSLFNYIGNSFRIGITGPPGAGKSSITNKLIKKYRQEGKSVAVIGIDPTSPFSGGAILGDRVRMLNYYNDENVFIRSMASRGSSGGLSSSSKEVADVLDAAGYDIIIFETVGVGQVELDIIQAADSVLVVLVPESGDDIQMMKAGLMEIADIFVINKSDRSGSDKLYSSIENILMESDNSDSKWVPCVVKTVAVSDQGIDILLEKIKEHFNFIQKLGLWKDKINEKYILKVEKIVSTELNNKFWSKTRKARLNHELSLAFEKRLSPKKLSNELYEL